MVIQQKKFVHYDEQAPFYQRMKLMALVLGWGICWSYSKHAFILQNLGLTCLASSKQNMCIHIFWLITMINDDDWVS